MDTVPVSLPAASEVISDPGAQMSTHGPLLEKSPGTEDVSFRSIANANRRAHIIELNLWA